MSSRVVARPDCLLLVSWKSLDELRIHTVGGHLTTGTVSSGRVALIASDSGAGLERRRSRGSLSTRAIRIVLGGAVVGGSVDVGGGATGRGSSDGGGVCRRLDSVGDSDVTSRWYGRRGCAA